MPVELQREVIAIVKQTQARTRWPVRRILRHLEVAPASYHRWRSRFGAAGGIDGASTLADGAAPASRASPSSLFQTLPSERQSILDYACSHPELRHRELAWRMLDDDVCAVSPSTVYRVLWQADLVCRWKPQTKQTGRGRPDAPTTPDQPWQTDIRYVKVNRRNYYLLAFLDVYARYIVHHELLRLMDGLSVSIAAATAIGKLPPDAPRPTIQSDHGSCFIAREFAETLDAMAVGHHLIRPHTPTDNAEIERCNRTLGERIDEELAALAESESSGGDGGVSFAAAETVIDDVIDHYNHHRLHSSLNFLRPVDYYRGDPEALLAERRRKLSTARELRKQENLKLRQHRLPFPAAETVSYSERRVVSL